MSDYIKRKDAIKAVCMKCQACIGKRTMNCGEAKALLALPAADVVERPRWNPVTKHLPENDCRCLVFADGEVREASFYCNVGKFFDPVEEYEKYDASHWMLLPEPPKEIDT